MKISLEKLATLTNSEVSGDKNILVSGVATLKEAGKGEISFVSNTKYKKYLDNCKASAVILSPELARSFSGNALINRDPYLTYAKVLKIIYQDTNTSYSVHEAAVIDEGVNIGEKASIGANVVIETGALIGEGVSIGAGSYIGKNSVLGDNVMLHSNVTLYADTKVGHHSIIHSGAVIGADGFGFAPQQDKSWYKIEQIGNVVIGSDVEIGANTTIDRGALGSTQIAKGVKLDNQIQVAHNVHIEAHTVVAAGTVIAGSTSIGKYCQIGGAVAIAGHLNIADDVIITGKSMVIKSINKPGVYSSGITSDENRTWRKNLARFKKLDEMAKTIKYLEKRLMTNNDEG